MDVYIKDKLATRRLVISDQNREKGIPAAYAYLKRTYQIDREDTTEIDFGASVAIYFLDN